MEYAYLGLFQKVFEWVLSKIFDPVFRFVSNLLTTVLSWLFEEVLAPILLPVLQEAFEFFIELWKLMYSRQLYLLFTGVLKLIDYLEKAFDVFIGLQDVTYTEANGTVISGTLVEVLMQQKAVSTAFWALTLGALGLAMLLTIYATAKSAFDLDFEQKRPVSKVLAAMMKTFIQFFTVPFFVYFFLKLSAVILKGVTTVLNFGGETTLGRIVFTIASLDAAKQEGYNISDMAAGVEVGVTDSVREPFYRITGSDLKDYGKMSDVNEVFYLEKFDYLIGFIAAVFLLFTIGVCLIVFVQRIFELCMLYLASPYFVCMIPLDDGEKFSRWREMFIGKCFTGFGSAVGMRLFLMICPMIMGNRIRFGTASSPEMDYMMKLFFLAGGAWAVYKSGPMITSLLSSQAGASEANTAATAGGMLYAYTAGALISKGQQGLQSMMRPGGRGGRALQAEGGPGGTGITQGQQGKFNGFSGAKGTAQTAWHKPPNKPLPPIPGGLHKPPNKPLPPIPSGLHKPPNKPLPPIPGGLHKPPNKPLPPIPGSGLHKPPNKPLPSIPGSGLHKPPNKSLPPVPGSGLHKPSDKPLPKIPVKGVQPGKLEAGAAMGTGMASSGDTQQKQPYTVQTGKQPLTVQMENYGDSRNVYRGSQRNAAAFNYMASSGYYRTPNGRRVMAQIYHSRQPNAKLPASAYGTAYGRYWMNQNSYGYIYNSNGQTVAKSFPGSAVRSGADIVRAGYGGHAGYTGYGGHTGYTGTTGITGTGAASAESGGGSVQNQGEQGAAAKSSGGAFVGTANPGTGASAYSSVSRPYSSERPYQVTSARIPVTSVRTVQTGSSPGKPVNYSSIGIRGVSPNTGQSGRQFTRRNTL